MKYRTKNREQDSKHKFLNLQLPAEDRKNPQRIVKKIGSTKTKTMRKHEKKTPEVGKLQQTKASPLKSKENKPGKDRINGWHPCKNEEDARSVQQPK